MLNLLDVSYISKLLAGGGEYFPYELIAIIFAFTVFIVVGLVYLAIKFLILKHKNFSKKDESDEVEKKDSDTSKNDAIQSDEDDKANTTKKDEK